MAQHGINPKQIKSYNDTALLYLLSAEGILSRKAISAKLNLTAAAVSKITKRLIDSDKIEELGVSAQENDRVGRKEVLLSLKSADKFRNSLVHGNALLASKFLHAWIDGEFAKPFPSHPFGE